jgi:hypothetical protein
MKEPKNTCPNIDSAISLMDSVKKEAKFAIKNFDHMTNEQIKECFSEIINELKEGPDVMEEIRSANENLRAWGHEWRYKAQEL